MSGVAKSVSKLFQPVWKWAAVSYQARIGKELKKYGLRYDDLYDDNFDLDVAEALRRLPQSEVDARTQRLKRAMDLSLKHIYLPKELQEEQTPYDFYLQDMLKQVKAERAEKAALGTGMPYNRQLP